MAILLGGGLLLSSPTPVAAAPPEREKSTGTYSYLTISSFTCSVQNAVEACTAVDLSAYPGSADEQDVSVSITAYVRGGDGNLEEVGYEWGVAHGVLTLTLTAALEATLLPTTLTLSSIDCSHDGCDVHERDVVVSALAHAVEPITNRLQHGSFPDGDCKIRFSTRTTSAPVEGTITVEEGVHEGTGSAQQENYRASSLCK